jgi:predicted nucleic acid-binding protein
LPASRRIERLVVDANPLIAVLLGGAAVRVFLSYPDRVREFAVCEHTLQEVRDFIPELAEELEEDPERLRLVLALLPLEPYPPQAYEAHLEEAELRIARRDPDDVDVLALTLELGCPLWSNDRDFEDVGVEQLTTAQLLQQLEL